MYSESFWLIAFQPLQSSSQLLRWSYLHKLCQCWKPWDWMLQRDSSTCLWNSWSWFDQELSYEFHWNLPQIVERAYRHLDQTNGSTCECCDQSSVSSFVDHPKHSSTWESTCTKDWSNRWQGLIPQLKATCKGRPFFTWHENRLEVWRSRRSPEQDQANCESGTGFHSWEDRRRRVWRVRCNSHLSRPVAQLQTCSSCFGQFFRLIREWSRPVPDLKSSWLFSTVSWILSIQCYWDYSQAGQH